MQISQGKWCHVELRLMAALISAVLVTGAAGSEASRPSRLASYLFLLGLYSFRIPLAESVQSLH